MLPLVITRGEPITIDIDTLEIPDLSVYSLSLPERFHPLLAMLQINIEEAVSALKHRRALPASFPCPGSLARR
jgi:hypothetical protein